MKWRDIILQISPGSTVVDVLLDVKARLFLFFLELRYRKVGSAHHSLAAVQSRYASVGVLPFVR